ncbi:MAG TPA: tetratricopeptide repeat protein [Longimicrobiales bacterium]|nr:tetratricopeptide repeat protein [Longimicrobiales bacterium]
MTLLSELKRRKVFRVAAVYAATAFVVLQAADIMLPRVGVPDWVMSLVVVLTVLGFPVALVLAWALELTPEGGIKRTAVEASGTSGDPPPVLGKRTLFAVSLLVVLGIGLGAGWFLRPASDPAPDSTTAVGLPVDRSIAVLPFADLSPEGDQAYFSDGLAEEILNLLAQVRDLSVASRTSAFSLESSGLSIPEIADRLGVQYILEGSVRRAGDRIRVTAQLIDARTDRHLWSENFDRTLADVFAVQDEIAVAIGEALQVRLRGRDGGTVTATQIAPDLYERFLQSRFLLRQRNLPAIARATELLEEVVEGEPGYAPALAQLAEAHLLSGGTAGDPEELRERFDLILELVGRALAIDPSLAGAHAVRGNVAMTRGEYRAALVDYRRAIELDPDDPRAHHWLALLYSDAGHLDRAERAIAESLRLDPENANAQGWRADLLVARGQWDDALDVARDVVELGNPVGHVASAMYLMAIDPARNVDRAESEMRLALARGAPADMVPLKMIEFARGDEAALGSLMDDVRANRLWLFIATTALLALEQREALLTLLEWDEFLYDRLVPMVWSSERAAMRRDPRFVDYLRRQGVVDLWREIGPPPDCVEDGDTFRCGMSREESDR